MQEDIQSCSDDPVAVVQVNLLRYLGGILVGLFQDVPKCVAQWVALDGVVVAVAGMADTLK